MRTPNLTLRTLILPAALALAACGSTDALQRDTNDSSTPTGDIELSQDPLVRLDREDHDMDGETDEEPGFGNPDFMDEFGEDGEVEEGDLATGPDGRVPPEDGADHPDRPDRPRPEPRCLHGEIAGRWVNVPHRDGGVFGGRWLTAGPSRPAFVFERYGVTPDGRPWFRGKIIERNGRFRGLVRGNWHPDANRRPDRRPEGDRTEPGDPSNPTEHGDASGDPSTRPDARPERDRTEGRPEGERPERPRPEDPNMTRPNADGVFHGGWRYRGGRHHGEMGGFYTVGRRARGGHFEGGWHEACEAPQPEPRDPNDRPHDEPRDPNDRPGDRDHECDRPDAPDHDHDHDHEQDSEADHDSEDEDGSEEDRRPRRPGTGS